MKKKQKRMLTGVCLQTQLLVFEGDKGAILWHLTVIWGMRWQLKFLTAHIQLSL